MTNALKLGAAAFRGVPVPKPGESPAEYGVRLRDDWARGRHRLYIAAGALACIANDLIHEDPAEAERIMAANNAPRLPTDIMSNGRSRADFNAAQAAQMRRRRSVASNTGEA